MQDDGLVGRDVTPSIASNESAGAATPPRYNACIDTVSYISKY